MSSSFFAIVKTPTYTSNNLDHPNNQTTEQHLNTTEQPQWHCCVPCLTGINSTTAFKWYNRHYYVSLLVCYCLGCNNSPHRALTWVAKEPRSSSSVSLDINNPMLPLCICLWLWFYFTSHAFPFAHSPNLLSSIALRFSILGATLNSRQCNSRQSNSRSLKVCQESNSSSVRDRERERESRRVIYELPWATLLPSSQYHHHKPAT